MREPCPQEHFPVGQAVHGGEISLAALLIVGFALYNATEGFGIVGPLAGAGVRASSGWLALAGLIGGGPAFLGPIMGTSFDSLLVCVGCLAVAAGAILQVIAHHRRRRPSDPGDVALPWPQGEDRPPRPPLVPAQAGPCRVCHREQQVFHSTVGLTSATATDRSRQLAVSHLVATGTR
jgi:hypothetical protein